MANQCSSRESQPFHACQISGCFRMFGATWRRTARKRRFPFLTHLTTTYVRREATTGDWGNQAHLDPRTTHVTVASRKRSGATRNPLATVSLSSRLRPIAVLLTIPVTLRVPAFRYFYGARGQKSFLGCYLGAPLFHKIPLSRIRHTSLQISSIFVVRGSWNFFSFVFLMKSVSSFDCIVLPITYCLLHCVLHHPNWNTEKNEKDERERERETKFTLYLISTISFLFLIQFKYKYNM